MSYQSRLHKYPIQHIFYKSIKIYINKKLDILWSSFVDIFKWFKHEMSEFLTQINI
jgi:hypothetical protein